MCRELERRFGTEATVALLAISRLNLKRYIKRRTGTPASSRRLIWLTHTLVFHPERVRTLFDLATWGAFYEGRKDRPEEDWSI
jgi:hypothetical protein